MAVQREGMPKCLLNNLYLVHPPSPEMDTGRLTSVAKDCFHHGGEKSPFCRFNSREKMGNHKILDLKPSARHALRKREKPMPDFACKGNRYMASPLRKRPGADWVCGITTSKPRIHPWTSATHSPLSFPSHCSHFPQPPRYGFRI